MGVNHIRIFDQADQRRARVMAALPVFQVLIQIPVDDALDFERPCTFEGYDLTVYTVPDKHIFTVRLDVDFERFNFKDEFAFPP